MAALEQTVCRICSSGEDEANMLLCDTCDAAGHHLSFPSCFTSYTYTSQTVQCGTHDTLLRSHYQVEQ